MSEHRIHFTERTLVSVRCACICGWKAEVMTAERDRQSKLNAKVAEHLANLPRPVYAGMYGDEG